MSNNNEAVDTINRKHTITIFIRDSYASLDALLCKCCEHRTTEHTSISIDIYTFISPELPELLLVIVVQKRHKRAKIYRRTLTYLTEDKEMICTRIFNFSLNLFLLFYTAFKFSFHRFLLCFFSFNFLFCCSLFCVFLFVFYYSEMCTFGLSVLWLKAQKKAVFTFILCHFSVRCRFVSFKTSATSSFFIIFIVFLFSQFFIVIFRLVSVCVV